MNLTDTPIVTIQSSDPAATISQMTDRFNEALAEAEASEVVTTAREAFEAARKRSAGLNTGRDSLNRRGGELIQNIVSAERRIEEMML